MPGLIRKNKLYCLFLLLILAIALFIRFHNLKSYNTFWADDGGGHIAYVAKIANEHRLPTLDETYLAWHEPLYYGLVALWAKAGRFFSLAELDWWESFNILVFVFWLILVWFFSYFYSQKNKWLALLNTFIFSILFISVKLSAYINNELLLHTLVLLLLVLFWRFDLLSKSKDKKVVYWSLILAIGALVKITALIILFSALLIWLIRRQWKYMILCLLVVFSLNLPWLLYKQQNFNSYFSINIYDDKPRQNIITSSGWKYLTAVNRHIFTDYPYWFSKPDSYFSILLSDSFGDYYNLFNNYVKLETMPADQKILVGNGRYTTPQAWQSMLNINRLGLLIFAIWFFGFLFWLVQIFKNKKINNYDLFLLIALVGGWSASIFHNLRLPYLEAGVLKGHFIFYTYPILVLLAYRQWWNIFNKKIYLFVLAFAPWLIYLIIAWHILLVV